MTTTLPGRSANNALGRSRTAFVGMARMTISAPLAGSATETGLAPSSATNAVRLSGPFEFAIETRWPSLTRWRARIPPMLPAPLFRLSCRLLLFRPANRPHLPARSAAAEEPILAIGLEPRHAEPGRQLQLLQDFAGLRIDAPQIAFIPLPGAVPEIPVDPRDPGDEAVGFDGAKDRPGLRVDLMDLARAIFAHPEAAFRPREPRITAVAGRRNRAEHTAALRVDLLDAILGDLEQMRPVERGPGVRGDIDCAHGLAARRIQCVQPVSRGKPDIPAVVRDTSHVVDARKGSVLANNLGG